MERPRIKLGTAGSVSANATSVLCPPTLTIMLTLLIEFLSVKCCNISPKKSGLLPRQSTTECLVVFFKPNQAWCVTVTDDKPGFWAPFKLYLIWDSVWVGLNYLTLRQWKLIVQIYPECLFCPLLKITFHESGHISPCDWYRRYK